MAKTQNNEALASLAEKESKIAGQRAASGGADRVVGRLDPCTSETYKWTIMAGEDAVIVIGDGDCDLDLFVYDENGNLIDEDTDGTDRCVCDWNHSWTGQFKVKVNNNRGCNVYSGSVLLHN